jgi:hypothetical protein
MFKKENAEIAIFGSGLLVMIAGVALFAA